MIINDPAEHSHTFATRVCCTALCSPACSTRSVTTKVASRAEKRVMEMHELTRGFTHTRLPCYSDGYMTTYISIFPHTLIPLQCVKRKATTRPSLSKVAVFNGGREGARSLITVE
ncbi:hypothetical protein E2C01_042350 [Portunus trituberculatus]|uniref:Uncharacterized protein n=1 Tax=Portunus trituberculatus TaxID=210409 RepID=A0A5B7FW86_PORTR|nr:hypothetical protein [Portunus trituberculatus]